MFTIASMLVSSMEVGLRTKYVTQLFKLITVMWNNVENAYDIPCKEETKLYPQCDYGNYKIFVKI